MDKASIIGILIGASALGYVFFEVSHGHLSMFFSMEGVLMVGCGSVSVVFMAMPLERLMCVPGYIKSFLFHKSQPMGVIIKQLAGLSEKARRDGILALESEMAAIKDPFLAAGLKMAVDGIEPAQIESTARMELMAMQDRHKSGKKFFDLIKLYGPGYGLVGTLVGQVGMFGKLASADIGALGHALAVGAEQGLDALVHLDARDDALGLHQLHQRRAVVRVLVQRLLEQDDTRDVLLQACTAKNST